MSSDAVDTLINFLWRSGDPSTASRVYVLLDAARNDQIYPNVLKSGMESACLFRGQKAEELAWFAPYLVQLDREAPFTTWALEKGWGKSWGVFVESLADLRELKRHFQSFLTVYDEDGKSFLFRYYDPRVLRIYLPTCNAGEIRTVFGPVNAYIFEDEDASVIMRLSVAGGDLQIEKQKRE